MVSNTESFSIRSSFSKWAPLISTLLLTGITYGVQRTSLALYVIDLSGSNIMNILIFLQISSTLITYGLFKGIAGFFSSRISSRIKRKNTMRIGLGLLVIGSVSIFLAKYINLTGLILGNVFIGAGLGLFFTASMSALTEIAGAEGSAFSVGSMEFSVYLGSSIGSFFAGLIVQNQGNNFAASFTFALIVAGVAVVIGILLLRNVETQELVEGTKEEILLDSTKVETKWSLRNIVKTPTLLLSYLAGHFSRIMDSLIVLLLPILVSSSYGFTATQVGLVTAGFTLAWAISMPFTGKLSDRFGRKGLIVIGLVTEGLALVLITITKEPIYVISLAIAAGIGTAIYYPSLPSITRDVVPIIKREQSFGLYRASLDSGYFTGPLIAMGLAFSATKLNLWSDTQLENQLKFPFLVIGISLGVLALLFLFLAMETRPGWVQASISLKHGNKVKDVYMKMNQALEAYIDNKEIDCCTDILSDAKELERDADKLVFRVTQALYGQVRPAPDDYHFYKITDILDTSIGFTLRSMRKLLMIPRQNLPEKFVEYLKIECELLVKMITKTVDALEVVCIQPLSSHPIFEEVHNLEKELDLNSQEGLASVTKDSGKLNPVETLYVIQIIESLEQSANHIEDAVDVMKIVGLKYQVRPLVI
ncbi:MAG: MFS transporter [Candidatus Heimdallarchaeota archaeon]|nr:MFS transporter [Candidatus Heimdallarchaeota archaeon]